MQVFLGILGLMGVMWAASMGVQLVATVVMMAALGPERGPLAIIVVSQLGGALFGLLPMIGATTAYHELRVAREGLDAGHLAAVFD
jgi:2-succinyl-5-enolpyruvyl-6-hydroxy-3-cyclohexene-1-carboxylate synthase